MILSVLTPEYTVAKLAAMPEKLPEGFISLTKTRDELSLVCESSKTPTDALVCEPGWRALKVEGPLDFSLVGILSRIAGALAKAGISIFVISTYDTDYILVKADRLDAAVGALRKSGMDCR